MFFKYIRKDKLKNKTMNSFIKKAFSLLLIGCFFVLGLGVVRVNAETVDFDFSNIDGFNNWGSSYAEHTVVYDEGTVTFSSANKQTSTITNMPVTKGQPVSFVLGDDYSNYYISSYTFVCHQWTNKGQTITAHYSTDGGEHYTSTGVTSTNFTITASELNSNTNAIKITFSSSDNQIGIESLSITLSEKGAAPQVAVTGVSLQETAEIQVGDSLKLTPTFEPAEPSNKNVTWKSSNPSVATVSSTGLVTAVSLGNATITVTTEDGGFTASCNVKVVPLRKGIINFGSATGSTNVNDASISGNDSLNNEWLIETEGTTSFTPNAAYSQIGSSNKPASSITFTTTLSNNLIIDSLKIKLGGFSGTSGDVVLKIDNTEVGSGSLNATNDVVIESTKILSGKTITIEITNIAKGVKVYNITYHYLDSYSYIQGSVGLDANDQGAFRLLGIANEEFDSYGVAYKNSTGTWHESSGTPYESVYAYNGEEKVSYTAESLGASIIFGVEVIGLPEGVYTVSIKSFVEIDSVKYYSTERTFTITVNDSGVAVVEA